MTARELIKKLLEFENIDKKIVLYSLVKIENIDTKLPEFEFISSKINSVDILNNKICINGEY